MKTKKGTLLCLSIFLTGLLAGAAGAGAAAGAADARAAFGYPVDGEAWYSIRATFSPPAGLAGTVGKVVRVEVNKARCRDFVLFQDGKELNVNEVKMGQPFEVKARAGWLAKTNYAVDLVLEDLKAGNKVPLDW